MSFTDLRLVRRALTSSLVDSLTAPHGVDRYLELVDPHWTVNEVRGRVERIWRQTPTSATITLALNGAWAGHVAGQFVRVGAPVDGTLHTRCYSIETPPSRAGATTIEITVGAHPDGTLSPHLVRDVQPGDVLRLSQAEGEFTLPSTLPSTLVLLAAGTGITPLMGMVRTLCADRRIADVDVTLVAYAATPTEHLHTAELERLAAANPRLRVVRGCTDVPGAAELDGLFAPEHLADAAPAWRDAELFACGPNPFMAAVAEVVDAAGIGEHLHTEAFAPTFAPLPPVGTMTGSVTFASSNQRADDVTTSILDAAEGAGLRPAHGCRMGISHTCTRTKQAGCVRDLRTGDVSGPEASEIQICVSAPVGDVVVDL
jgi:ferredoxin-NADP reductase